MAQSAAHHSAPALHIGNPLAGLARLMVRIIETHPLSREIDKLNAMSDAELAARGTTRADATAQMFRGRYYL